MRNRGLGVLSPIGRLHGWLVSGRSEGVPRVSEVGTLMLVDGCKDVAILDASDGGQTSRLDEETPVSCAHTRHEASPTRARLIVAQLLSG